MRIETHAHTEFSQLRMLDCIVKVPQLIKQAASLGLSGVAITDHESVSGHVRFIQTIKSMKSSGELPEDFKGILGNEIYLVDKLNISEDGKKSCDSPFYHYILLAKDEIGHKQLRELSSLAWDNSFYTGRMERVPTLKSDLEHVVKSNPGHLISTTACLGGELGKSLLAGENYMDFLLWNQQLFGKDFYLEMQPGLSEEQIKLNREIVKLKHQLGIKATIACDVHYLKQEDREIHAAYLNSRDDEERELGDFYESTWMMTNEQIHQRMDYLGYEEVEDALKCSLEIGEKVEEYDLYHTQIVPKAKIPEFTMNHSFKTAYDFCPYIKNFAYSKEKSDRYLLYLIEDGWWTKQYLESLTKEEIKSMMLRINDELGAIWETSEKLNDRVSSYYITALDIINMMWDDSEDGGGSLVGPSRGSIASFYISYLINLQQINPLKYNIPWWRHLHASRPEMPDVDIDTEASKRQRIIEATRKRYGYDKVLNICTFKTEGSKSAILTTARGMRIDNDIAQYLAGMIPVTRGKTASLTEMKYGNEEDNVKPATEFLNECKKYPGLLDTAMAIEGLVCGRSIHASGVIIFDAPYLEHNAMMKAPNGQPVTQWDMDNSSYCGGLKFDYLTIQNLDAMHLCLDFLVKYGYIEWQGTLRDTYNKYLHPDVLDYNSEEMWKMAENLEIVNLFQFQTQVGAKAIQTIKPRSLTELGTANAAMRLMVQGEDEEQPIDTFVRYKNNINEWYKCMKQKYQLNDSEIGIIEKYLKSVHGMATMQEEVMQLSMDKHISDFTMTEANYLRKSIAKKKKKLQKEAHDKFYKHGLEIGTRINMLDYVWNEVIRKQLGYSFSLPHIVAYSTIAVQEMNLAYHYPLIYWNAANLIVDAGANEEIEDNKSTKYGKIASAIANFKQRSIIVDRPLINEAKFSFVPDEKNNRIIFSFKGLCGIGDDIARAIVEHQPYSSFEDFCKRMVDTKIIGTAKMIILIKAGCFNELDSPDRMETMKKFLSRNVFTPTDKLTMQQFNSALEYDIFPKEMETMIRIKNFKAYALHESFFLKNIIDEEKKIPKKGYHDRYFALDERGTEFLMKHFNTCIVGTKEDGVIISEKLFNKEWDALIQPLKDYMALPETLQLYNQKKLDSTMESYASGSLEQWDMESLSYYPDRHELWNLNEPKYGVVDYNSLPEIPEVYDYTTRRVRGEIKHFPKYKIFRLAGTVLDSDNNKHLVTLLTNHSVVTCKYNKGQYSYYNKRISEQTPAGKKKVLEESWFKRGSKIIVCGYRREDQFVIMKYPDTVYTHTTNRIEEIYNDGTILAQTDRKKVGER